MCHLVCDGHSHSCGDSVPQCLRPFLALVCCGCMGRAHATIPALGGLYFRDPLSVRLSAS